MSSRICSFEPATGSLLWEGDSADTGEQVQRVHSTWLHWAAQPVTNRIETLRRFANLVRREEAGLADLISRETGKPLWDAQSEVAAVIANVDHAISAYSERSGQRRLEGALGTRQTLRHKPHGVLAIITPHCLPAQIPNSKILPALIAGNGVILKPAVQGTATASFLVGLYHEAGVPKDILCIAPGGDDVGKALTVHDGVDGILCTGSVRTGLAVHHTLSSRPDRLVALEMGGNNPIVVWDTPDLLSAAMLVVQSAFTSSGQHCMAARRVIVRDGLAAELMDEVKKIVDRLIIGPPSATPAPFMGPVANNQVADGLTESFLYLMNVGGRPIKHPRRIHGELPFLTPAIIDMTNASERPDVELFGPILQVMRVTDFDSAIREANGSCYGLSASLIGGGPEHYNQFWSLIRAGAINWNRVTNVYTSNGPLGGIGMSGNHRAGGSYMADSCSYPVSSSETEQIRTSIGIGLAPIDTSKMGD